MDSGFFKSHRKDPPKNKIFLFFRRGGGGGGGKHLVSSSKIRARARRARVRVRAVSFYLDGGDKCFKSLDGALKDSQSFLV